MSKQKEPSASITINASSSKPTRFTYNPSATPNLQRQALREALAMVMELCHMTKVPFGSLMSDRERTVMAEDLNKYVPVLAPITIIEESVK